MKIRTLLHSCGIVTSLFLCGLGSELRAQLSVSPPNLSFTYQIGAPSPQPQILSVNSTPPGQNFTATPVDSPWLQVQTTAPATTPGMATVSVNPAVLGSQAGSYSGRLNITIPGNPSSAFLVPVTLTVSPSPALNVSPGSFAFFGQTNGNLPAAQSLSLTSSAGPTSNLPFTLSIASNSPAGPWLSVNPLSGVTPNSGVAVSVDRNVFPNIPAGTYSGSITVSAQGASNPSQTIPVMLTVSANPLLIANPTAVSFSYQMGGSNPSTQAVMLSSTGPSLAYTVTPSADAPWITIDKNSGVVPAGATDTLNIGANPAGLPAGNYIGSVVIGTTGTGNPSQSIRVSLTVSTSTLLSVVPGTLSFAFQTGGSNPANQVLTVNSTGAPLAVTVAAAVTTPAGGPVWLTVTPSTGTFTTPATFTISANQSNLPVGSYMGIITVTSPGAANTVTIPVTFVISNSPLLLVSPAALNFSVPVGGILVTQVLSVASTGAPIGYSATTAGGPWLGILGVPQGTTAANITVVVNPAGLGIGTYNGSIRIDSTTPGTANTPQTIPVTVNVTSAATLTVTPATLSFAQPFNGPKPATQTITVGSSSGTLNFQAAATTIPLGGGWLTVTPNSGPTPATLTVSADGAGLSQGTYTGQITVFQPNVPNSQQTVTVTLTIGPALAPPTILAIKNAASFLPTPAAPGLILTLGGTNIGPPTLTTLQLTTANTVSTNLANTRVLFDGIPSPLIYVSSTQSSVIVPYEIAGRNLTNVQVEFNGVLSNTVQLQVTDASPGIFSLASSGAGQGAILNQPAPDGRVTVNGPAAPAPKGSVVSIYATGEGQTRPGGVTGSITSNATTFPVGTVTATIGGQPATIQYAGEAPGLVAGVLQVNAVIPDGAGSGPQDLVITVNGHPSQTNLKVTVQ